MFPLEVENKYTYIKELGYGNYGRVILAKYINTGDKVAIKHIKNGFYNIQVAQRTYREYKYLKLFSRHPNIITLIDAIVSDDEEDLYLVFEYFPSNLKQLINKGIYTSTHRLFIIYQLIRAVETLHSNNVIHRDIKPENILINKDKIVRLADFGLSRCCVSSNYPLTDYVTTLWYRSPENILLSTDYNQQSDMWSIGCILAELILGRPLFRGIGTIDQIVLILKFCGTVNDEDIKSLKSDNAYEFIKNYNIPNRKRQSVTNLFYDATYEEITLLNNLLVFNPEKRMTSKDILKSGLFDILNINDTKVDIHIDKEILEDEIVNDIEGYIKLIM